LDTPLSSQQFIDSVRRYRERSKRASATIDVSPKALILSKQLGETIQFTFITRDTINRIAIWSDEKKEISVNDSLVATDEGYHYDYLVEYPGKYMVSIMVYFDKGGDEIISKFDGEYLFDIMKRPVSKKRPAPQAEKIK
jgi:hypothetical protein